MFQQPIFQIDIPTVTAFIAVIITLLAQLLLCFKAKKMWIKILPSALFSVSALVFYICCRVVGGWDGMGYLYFALLSFVLIVICGIGWGIWAMASQRHL
ncbi:MAG: hypothetical protein IKK11_02915 [Oscillospiraceae bacterium]|nr:hypothetical protein [Oscillospiraceae bacterium]